MIQISIGGRGELECAEADVIQSLVVYAERLVGVLYQLVHRERGVIRLYHRVRHLQAYATQLANPATNKQANKQVSRSHSKLSSGSLYHRQVQSCITRYKIFFLKKKFVAKNKETSSRHHKTIYLARLTT